MKMNHDVSSSKDDDVNPMDLLLAKLSEQQAVITRQHVALKTVDDISFTRTAEYVANSSGSSVLDNQVTEVAASTAPTTGSGTPALEEAAQLSAEEVLRLKLELEQAKGRIARMDQELTQTRITKHTIEQAIGCASEADFPLTQTNDTSQYQQPVNVSARPQYIRDGSWNRAEDARSDTSDALSAGGFNRARAIWNNNTRQPFPGALPEFQAQPTAFPNGAWVGRGFAQQMPDSAIYGPPAGSFRNDRLTPELDSAMGPPGDRRNNNRINGRLGNRNAAAYNYAGSNGTYEGFGPAIVGYGSVAGMSGGVAGSGMGMGGGSPLDYQPQPIGTPLSPFAPEFTTSGGGWKNDVSAIMRSIYLLVY
jgi:hypothetical protein